MFAFNGLLYLDLTEAPTYEQAVLAAGAGRILAASSQTPNMVADWTQEARILCLSMMHKWQAVPGTVSRTPTKEAALFESVKALLLNGRYSSALSLTLGSITNQCIDGLAEDSRTDQYCPRQVIFLRHAVCYLSYGMNMGNNQLVYVQGFKEKFDSCFPPFHVTCLHCQTVFPYDAFLGLRMHRHRLIDNPTGTRWLCTGCIDAYYRFSRFMGEYVPVAEAVFPAFLARDAAGNEEDCVSITYARNNFFWEVDEDDADSGEWIRERPDTSHLLNYSANPFNYNEWDERNAQNALVFGVELEMEPTNQSETGQMELIQLLGGSCRRGSGYILKSDGSLSCGVELVTMPFTVEQHKEEKAIKWNKLLSAVNRGKARSGRLTEACGMHIHINKAALSALTIGKMLVFLNSETLSPLISTIAQRGSGHFCSRDGAKKVTDGIKRSDNRYDIMNVSRSHPTCEVRMFRGNLRPERVYKNLEFCHALVQYCRNTSLQDLQDWGNFSRWLVSKRGHYPYLVQFLVDKQAVGFRQLVKEANEHYSAVSIQEV